TTIAIWYFAAIGASFSHVGPGTGSAASYQRLSWPGQKYGPLKISCRQRIWTPFLPASWIIGRCFSSIAAWISATDLLSSLIGLLAWMRPLMTLRAMDRSPDEQGQLVTSADVSFAMSPFQVSTSFACALPDAAARAA